MIIIDVDAVKNNPEYIRIVNTIIRKKLGPAKTQDGRVVMVPATPIYFFSREKITIDQVDEMGFEKVGHVWGSLQSIKSGLNHMLERANDFSKMHGMGEMRTFRHPVIVITDKEFQDIRNFSADPLPVSTLRFFKNGVH